MDENNNSTEMIAMTLIANSGNARSLAFEAFNAVKEGNFEEAEKMLAEAEESLAVAHKVQMDLLVSEANGEKTELGILLVHAQDHFMTSLLAFDMMKVIIEMQKKIMELEKK